MICRSLVPVIVALCAATFGCASGADDVKSADVANTAWVVGNWKGTASNLSTDVGASLTEGTDAYATFVADPKDKSATPGGSFAFTFPKLPNTYTKGTFMAMGGDVLLDVSESTFSLIGNSGLRNLSYVVTGSSMSLQNKTVKLLLVRSDGTAPGAQTPTGTQVATTTTKLGGHWTCLDNAAATWSIFVKSDTQFDVKLEQNGSSPLWMSGAVVLLKNDAEKDAVLTVTSGNAKGVQGLEFYPKVLDDTDMSFVRTAVVNSVLTKVETVNCRRDLGQ